MTDGAGIKKTREIPRLIHHDCVCVCACVFVEGSVSIVVDSQKFNNEACLSVVRLGSPQPITYTNRRPYGATVFAE